MSALSYEQFFASAFDLMAIASPDGYFKKVNRAFSETLGYGEKVLLAKPLLEFVHPDDRAPTQVEIEKILAGRTVLAFENRYLCRDGSVRWLSWHASLDSGQGLILGVARDITEARRTAAALNATAERLHYVLDATGDAVWDCDFVSGIVTHNRRWCEMFGFTDDLLQHPVDIFYGLIHPDDKARTLALIGAVVASEGQYQTEFRMRHRSGEYLWVSDHGKVVSRDASGKATRMIGALADISRRKRAEDDLRLQTEAIAHMADGMNVVDSQGQILYANPTCEAMFGYAPGELIGQSVAILNSPDERDPEAVMDSIMQELEAHGEWRGEVLNRRKDGSNFWSRLTINSFQHEAYGRLWLTVQTDFSEAYELRLERDRAYRNLEYLTDRLHRDTEDLRRELAREVHDEIGALLTGIRMQIDAMDSRRTDDPKRRSGFDRLQRLVDQAVQRSRALCTRLRPPMLDDLGLVNTCRWYVGEWAAQSGIVVVTRLRSLTPEPADAVRTDAFRILQELLTNVARHAGASQVTVSLSSGRAGLRLTVKDNGSGFAAEASDNYGLLGIRERVRRHRGCVDIDSGAQGTSVSALIPLPGAAG